MSIRRFIKKNFEACLAAFSGLAMIAAICIYVYRFRNNPLGQPVDWASFGDFFSGVINPVIGLATVILVVVTLKVTRKEADDTRKKMDDQLALMAKDQKRQDIKRRLDGLLAEWNRVMDEKPTGRMMIDIGNDKDGPFPTKRRLLESPEVRSFLRKQRARHAETYPEFPEEDYTYMNWAEVVHDVTPLVREIDQCCIRYAETFFDSELPEFYRNRIRRVVDALHVAGFVRWDLANRVLEAKD